MITVAGMEDNVAALVYLAGYALAEGESLGELQGRFPDSDLASGLVYTSYPMDSTDEPGTDVAVDPVLFHDIFAADVDQELSRVLAVSQRPLAAAAVAEHAPAAAWQTKPAWGLVCSSDHTINPDVERFGYQRAGIRATEVDSSHLVMLSHPKEVADLIGEALTHLQVSGTAGQVPGGTPR